MNFCILLSGGTGKRMHLNIPKQYISINNRPIIIHTLQTIDENDNIDSVVIVADPEYHNQIRKWIQNFHITKKCLFVSNGDSRQESILSGLEKCFEMSSNEDDIVVIHDAVRPFVSNELINKCISALDGNDGVLPVVPVKDTLYYSATGKQIDGLLDRDKIYAGQAPEVFCLNSYYNINKRLSKQELENIKGSTEIAYKHNLKIKIVVGEETNFKITTTSDLERYKGIVENEGICS